MGGSVVRDVGSPLVSIGYTGMGGRGWKGLLVAGPVGYGAGKGGDDGANMPGRWYADTPGGGVYDSGGVGGNGVSSKLVGV
jgi:hypothetical protein